MSPKVAFDYGNARIRALKAELLDGHRYRDLTRTDMAGLIAAMSETPYRPDLEAAAPRYSELRLLQESLRTNLARSLRGLAGWYGDDGESGVGLLLQRWDQRNARAILRGQYSGASPDEIKAGLVPAGETEPRVLDELAGQADLRRTVELMVVWSVPNADAARAVLASWPDYERTGDFPILERALERSHADHLAAVLGGHDPVLARALRAEIDQTNVLTAIRLHLSGSVERDDVPPEERLLPGGSIPAPLLAAAARIEDPDGVVSRLAEARMPDAWRTALERWAETRNPVVLADELEEAVTRAAAGLFTSSDPLGIGIPVAYVWSKENEVRNLRTIGTGVAAALPPEMIEEDLVILW